MILLTGGGGYIGSILTQRLLEKGYKVRIYDRFFFGKKHLEPFSRKVDLVTGDIRNFDPKYLNGIEATIHLAALSNDPTAEFNPKANLEINYHATRKLALFARAAGVRKFLYASSCSVYYTSTAKTKKILTEDEKLNPKAPYSLSKRLSEIFLLSIKGKNFVPIILRAGTVYGFSPRMRYDLVVNTMTKDALSKKSIMVAARGMQWRPIVDIGDLCEAYITALEAPEVMVSGEIFNIVFGNFQIREIAKQIKAALNGNARIHLDNILTNFKDRSYKASNSKIEKMLRFKPKVSPEVSVRQMIRNIKKFNFTDFDNPKYYNINWMLTLAAINQEVFRHGPII